MTRLHSFQTAAARRATDPLVLDIDGQRITMRHEVGITELGTVVEQVSQTEGVKSFAALGLRREALIDSIRVCVHDDSLAAFDRVASAIDIVTASAIVKVLVEEYVGAANPTPLSSSSDGS